MNEDVARMEERIRLRKKQIARWEKRLVELGLREARYKSVTRWLREGLRRG